MLRRVVFVAIPTFFYLMPFAQIQLLIFLTSLYILFYSGVRPHTDPKRVKIEIFNEVMIMMMNYHMVCFSKFNLDANM